jgi:predicted dehydrogenase
MSKNIAKIGIVGAGWWALNNHIRLLSKNDHAELTAVCRLGKEELDRLQEMFGFKYATEDYDAMLKDVELDGVFVTSPHGLHYEHAKKALENGWHVAIEKPMTTNANEARELVALAESVNKQILVPFGWNFRTFTRKAYELISSGAIGEIQHVAAQMSSPLKELFNAEGHTYATEDFIKPDLNTWTNPNNYGGYGWGQIIHVLGCLFRIADELVPESVYGLRSNSHVTGCDVYNSVCIQFQNGATGSVSGAGTVPAGWKFMVDIKLYGTEGTLFLDLERERLELLRHDKANQAFPIVPGAGDYICEEPVSRFVDICRGEQVENEASGTVGLRTIEVVDAMYRSFDSGNAEGV